MASEMSSQAVGGWGLTVNLFWPAQPDALTHGGDAGPCKADVKTFCNDVSPGDGRIVTCLIKRLLQAKQGNIAGM